jgi:hypothetical protein
MPEAGEHGRPAPLGSCRPIPALDLGRCWPLLNRRGWATAKAARVASLGAWLWFLVAFAVAGVLVLAPAVRC